MPEWSCAETFAQSAQCRMLGVCCLFSGGTCAPPVEPTRPSAAAFRFGAIAQRMKQYAIAVLQMPEQRLAAAKTSILATLVQPYIMMRGVIANGELLVILKDAPCMAMRKEQV